MIIARPINHNEPCLLTGNRYKDLYLYALDGELIVRQNSPVGGWCYDSLEGVTDDIVSDRFHPCLCKSEGVDNPLLLGWEAFLGDKEYNQWIGSSEV